ncbi:hypothetical protein LFYK43_13900 [Ligilactobacillus salitolerans]|uniref:Flagellar assembly protein FliH n=1 Tax=Ligilactobacillus salitolerans TaxID=1808352 RepID=A0A401ITR4_9LACO|nr:hypothetical protein [Ligilactobacillus salitolerans]GBG94931.1 hypothetical protein LFYK43_13900 [Ligilactobacillus salitolerans]
MQLSSNVLKQQQGPLVAKKITLKTSDFINRAPKTETAPELVALDRELAQKTVAYQQELKKMKAAMLAEAKKEAADLKKKAYRTGLAEGKKAGFEQAFNEGNAKIAVLVEQAQKNVEQALEEVQTYKEQKQADFQKFAVGLAEVLLKTQLELDPAKITQLLSPLLFEFEKPDEVLMIWANSNYHDPLVSKMERIKQEVPDLRYVIFDDDHLEALQLKIESNEAVVEIDFEQELHDFLEQL